jgi:hypothetical protein
MEHQYNVGDHFIYQGGFEDLHGEIGEVISVRTHNYLCVMVTRKHPFGNFCVESWKMIPYNREPDWEV